MPNLDLVPALLYKLNENQLALEAAIMELTIWIEQQGLSQVGGNVRGALEVITQNEDFINVSLTTLMQPE
jgi:predicted XRE-type DNA-binding protein